MSISEMEQARHAEERGAILTALKQDYTSEITTVRSLARALDLTGHSLRPDGMQFHLGYLADSGYVKILRAKDMPGFRRDRRNDVRPDLIVLARLLPRGLQLIDGQIEDDPSVIF